MIQLYSFATLAWAFFWVLPGFVLKTIPTSTIAAIAALAIAMLTALATDRYWRPLVSKLQPGWPRYKAQFKGFLCVLAVVFFTRLIHYQIVHS